MVAGTRYGYRAPALLGLSDIVHSRADPGTVIAAITGPYARVRHPQYIAFIVIMFGFLLQWPTLVTLVMFPILVVTYVRLAHREEREVRAEFGPVWDAYAAETPSFVPRLRSRGPHQARPRDVHA